jgi:16S rRNA G966 N2-methylase RsmD
VTDAPRPRRALSQGPGRITLHGPPDLAGPLGDALHLQSEVDPDALTHGFHVWPGRMHRALAGRLLELLVPGRRATVVDPFVGGGTVAIEAMLRGHRAIGVDANPLSAMVVRVKSRLTSPDDREAFRVLVRHLAERSLERVRDRQPALAKLRGEHLVLYGPHTLKELAGLLEQIRALEREPIDPADREAALVVFSSIVTKLSNKRADTSEDEVRKRIRKGLSTELFERKAEELVGRWAALAEAARGVRPGPVEALTGDARALPDLLGRGPREVWADLILASPPYGGTYDYAEQHALRLDWLGIARGPFDRAEIGARRRADVSSWDRELGMTLEAMRAVLRGPEARIALLIGDAQLGPRRLDAHEHLLHLAPRVGLAPVCAASEDRPDYQGGPGRREHVVVLRPV